ncbi:MAG: AzlD domain-containing protein [Planctomycetota bacterium]|nr:AzlD domain-containing protein [Planctomycetota bacterium]
MTPWIMIIAIGVGTYLLRLSFLAMSKPTYPAGMAKALRYVPVTVLAALVAPKIFVINEDLTLIKNPYIIPAVLASLIAWSTKHLGLTIAGGLLAFWTLTWAIS